VLVPLLVPSAECGEHLVARGAARAGGEEAERNVEGERGEDGVAGGGRRCCSETGASP